MPELPEVETIVRELREVLIGKKFWKVEGDLASTFSPSLETFVDKLPGLEVLDIMRRGKYIIFRLDHNMCLGIHLRMTGRLLWKKSPEREKFLRAAFTFTDATQLFFSDVRKFGRMWLYPEKDFPKITGTGRLGLEILNPEVTFEKFFRLFQGRRGILKNTLLRQDLVAGIGNIYADEACFRARLHPSTRLEQMDQKDWERLYEAICFCLEEGIKHCGTSVSDFVGTRGKTGTHQRYLQVYGREGKSCYVCAETIQKMRAAGRGTFFCGRCQRRYGNFS